MIKRIIQRIIVGVSVALILSFIYSKVNADTYTNGNTLVVANFQQDDNVYNITYGTRRWSTYYPNSISDDTIDNQPYTIYNNLNGLNGNVYLGLPVGMQPGASISYSFCTNLPILEGESFYYSETYESSKWYRGGTTMITGTQKPILITNGGTIRNLSCFQIIGEYPTNSNGYNLLPNVNYIYLQISYIPTNREQTIISEVSNVQITTYSGQLRKQLTSLVSQQQQLNTGINDLNNNITDDSGVSNEDVSSNANDWSSNNANNGVINQLVQMPITLINGVVSGLSGTCSPYNLGNLFGTDLILPCVNMSNILGSVWTLIDVIISGVFIFLFGGRCVKIFNDFTNLRSGQIDQLYGGGN